MTKITKVHFHQKFLSGNFNYPTATDLPFMTTDEINVLYGWLSDILAGNTHVGANKPSGFKNGVPIPGADLYRDNNIWHYHCGPYLKNDDPPPQLTDNTLAENHLGRHSGPVYHYAKKHDTIIVLGFSRLHNPFPVLTSKKNPLQVRGTDLDDVAEFTK